MARLEIRLLGSFEVTLDGQPVRGFESDKVRALLAYLAVESDRPHRRSKLAGLLWPDLPEQSARTNLRRALSNLRTALGDHGAPRPVLDISMQTVQFDHAGDVWVDVLALQQHIADSRWQMAEGSGRASASSHPPSAISHLLSAVELYRGPFLEGFSLADSSVFEEWALLEQEQLHRLALEALHCLTEQLEEQRELEQALRHAWRQVELDPWRESGHQQVMRLLARTGERSAALAQYEACRRRLATDMGAEPSVETTALHQRILDQVDGPAGDGLPRRAALPLGQRAEPEGEALTAAVQATAQPQQRGAAPTRRRPEGVRLAAGAVALLAVPAVAALLALRPRWRPGAGVEPTGTTPVAARGNTGQSQPTTEQSLDPLPAEAGATAALALTDTFPCRIVFVSAELSATQTLGHIYVMDRDGRQRTLLPGYEEEVEESRPQWLPRGQGIIYERVVRTESAKRFSLWRMNPDGSGRQALLGDSDARAASPSPDGARIAYVSRRGKNYQLFIADLDGTDVVQVTQDERDSRRPNWSPDGQWLAFDAGGVASSSIYVVGLDGSGRKQLTAATQDTDAAWSPDGKFLALVSLRDGNAEIYVMNADGSGQVNVSNTPLAEDRDVSWTPDQHLVFASHRDGDWEIYLMNRNGSHVIKLTDNDVDDRWPNWK